MKWMKEEREGGEKRKKWKEDQRGSFLWACSNAWREGKEAGREGGEREGGREEGGEGERKGGKDEGREGVRV